MSDATLPYSARMWQAKYHACAAELTCVVVELQAAERRAEGLRAVLEAIGQHEGECCYDCTVSADAALRAGEGG